jgi:four helix bundle protein
MYGLTSQMRRAAVSVPANIAEGAARNTDKEFLQFLYIARGSLSELETHTFIAKKLDYLAADESLSAEIERLFALIGGLIASIQRRS